MFFSSPGGFIKNSIVEKALDMLTAELKTTIIRPKKKDDSKRQHFAMVTS